MILLLANISYINICVVAQLLGHLRLVLDLIVQVNVVGAVVIRVIWMIVSFLCFVTQKNDSYGVGTSQLKVIQSEKHTELKYDVSS